jgi:hypothetical protein
MICKNTDLLRTLVKEKKWQRTYGILHVAHRMPQRVESNMSLSQELQGLGKTGVEHQDDAMAGACHLTWLLEGCNQCINSLSSTVVAFLHPLGYWWLCRPLP